MVTQPCLSHSPAKGQPADKGGSGSSRCPLPLNVSWTPSVSDRPQELQPAGTELPIPVVKRFALHTASLSAHRVEKLLNNPSTALNFNVQIVCRAHRSENVSALVQTLAFTRNFWINALSKTSFHSSPSAHTSPGTETQRYSLGQPISHLAEEPHGPFPGDIWEFGISERCLNDLRCFLVHCRWKKRAKIPNCNLSWLQSGGHTLDQSTTEEFYPLDYSSFIR